MCAMKNLHLKITPPFRARRRAQTFAQPFLFSLFSFTSLQMDQAKEGLLESKH